MLLFHLFPESEPAASQETAAPTHPLSLSFVSPAATHYPAGIRCHGSFHYKRQGTNKCVLRREEKSPSPFLPGIAFSQRPADILSFHCASLSSACSTSPLPGVAHGHFLMIKRPYVDGDGTLVLTKLLCLSVTITYSDVGSRHTFWI